MKSFFFILSSLLLALPGFGQGNVSSLPVKPTFVATKPPMTLVWKEPSDENKTYTQPQAHLVFFVQGGDSTTRHEILLNGKVLNNIQRGFRKGFSVDENVPLAKGQNVVQVRLRRGDEVVLSEPRILVYENEAIARDKRVMLIVANQAYPGKALQKPVSDGLALKEKFEKLGYEVVLQTDQTSTGVHESLGLFSGKLKKANVGIFYYAGHGLMTDGKNYVEPIGANISTNSHVREFCVSLDLIQGIMKEANPHGTNLVFWDACRNNPSLAMRGGETQRAKANPPEGSVVIFATSSGETTPDDSPFAQEVIRQLDDPDLEITDLVRGIYKSLGSKGLKPYLEGFLPEKFYLNAR
jgi:hypothetical protein